ncbi:unnamed protein product [Schistosoma margrebowiei]|uniref:Uncharacterized protein n=1 Tax=Schistosoma margrebowiei TaxID=48269 RepID=A0A183N580_9TREM|nr:unnamed protein product [Schistosoma margrebowiei]
MEQSKPLIIHVVTVEFQFVLNVERDKKVIEKRGGSRTMNQFALKAGHRHNIKEDSRSIGGRHDGKYAHIKLISATSNGIDDRFLSNPFVISTLN